MFLTFYLYFYNVVTERGDIVSDNTKILSLIDHCISCNSCDSSCSNNCGELCSSICTALCANTCVGSCSNTCGSCTSECAPMVLGIDNFRDNSQEDKGLFDNYISNQESNSSQSILEKVRRKLK